MSDIPEQEENTTQPKKTRALSPNGKKRGPKPKPVNKKIRVRVREDLMEDGEHAETGNSLSYEPPRRAVSEDEKCEYVELTIMEQTDEPRECFFNNGVNRPLTVIRGHRVIIPYNYVITMDEINSIKLLKHEPIGGSNFREYYQPLMRFPYMIHRRGLTYQDFREQMDKFKKMPDPWDKARGQMQPGR